MAKENKQARDGMSHEAYFLALSTAIGRIKGSEGFYVLRHFVDQIQAFPSPPEAEFYENVPILTNVNQPKVLGFSGSVYCRVARWKRARKWINVLGDLYSHTFAIFEHDAHYIKEFDIRGASKFSAFLAIEANALLGPQASREIRCALKKASARFSARPNATQPGGSSASPIELDAEAEPKNPSPMPSDGTRTNSSSLLSRSMSAETLEAPEAPEAPEGPGQHREPDASLEQEDLFMDPCESSPFKQATQERVELSFPDNDLSSGLFNSEDPNRFNTPLSFSFPRQSLDHDQAPFLPHLDIPRSAVPNESHIAAVNRELNRLDNKRSNKTQRARRVQQILREQRVKRKEEAAESIMAKSAQLLDKSVQFLSKATEMTKGLIEMTKEAVEMTKEATEMTKETLEVCANKPVRPKSPSAFLS